MTEPDWIQRAWFATPSEITQYTFDDLLASAATLRKSDAQCFGIDMSDVGFIDPFGMIGLLLLARDVKRLGAAPLLLVLPEGNARGYLGRAGFVKVTQDCVQLDPPADEEWLARMKRYEGHASTLLEMTRLSDASDISGVLDHIRMALQKQLSYPKEEALDICICLSELCHNTFDHNETDVTCFVTVQTYKLATNPFVHVSVGDDGLGIPTTLRDNPKYRSLESDEDLVLRSFDHGVSRLEDPQRGTGLYHMAKKVLQHKGWFTVRSGEAKVYQRSGRGKPNTFAVGHLVGTQFSFGFHSDADS